MIWATRASDRFGYRPSYLRVDMSFNITVSQFAYLYLKIYSEGDGDGGLFTDDVTVTCARKAESPGGGRTEAHRLCTPRNLRVWTRARPGNIIMQCAKLRESLFSM